MVEGFTIFKQDGNFHYSPAFRRQGLSATFVANVTHVSSSPTLVIHVQHRDENEVTFNDAAAFSNITATGVHKLDMPIALKEVVRFKYEFSGGAADDAVHLVVQAPSWKAYE